MAELPEDDAYRETAPKSQSFMDVLHHYLEREPLEDPNDETLLWSLAGIHVSGCDNEFGRKYWTRLVALDTENLRWLVESALWVLESSGADTTLNLRQSLQELAVRLPDFQTRVYALAVSDSKDLARTAPIALQVVQGSSLFDASA